jgi:hypothetical protein
MTSKIKITIYDIIGIFTCAINVYFTDIPGQSYH